MKRGVGWVLKSSLFLCIAVTASRQFCKEPNKIDNAHHNGNKMVYAENAEVEYICNEGYFVESGSMNVGCSHGEWRGYHQFNCKKNCAQPKRIKGAFYEKTVDSFHSGAIVTYKCHHGVVAVGLPKALCQEGRWNYFEFNCPVADSTCDMPPILNKKFELISNLTHFENGAVVRYKCKNEYHKMKGIPLAICEDGHWIKPEIECIAQSCMHPGLIKNGKLLSYDFSSKATVTIRCDEGYEMEGDSVLTCMLSGTWDYQLPKCNPIHCHNLENPQNGKIVNKLETVFESTAVFNCLPNYRLHGSKVRKCLANKTWSGKPVTCEEIVCPELGKLENGYISGDGRHHGSVIYFICNKGTDHYGKEGAYCTDNGSWSNPLPLCAPYCRVPETEGVESAYKKERISRYWYTYQNLYLEVNEKVEDDTEIYFVCEDGYVPRKEESVTCLNGNWEPLIKCYPKPCRKITIRGKFSVIREGSYIPPKYKRYYTYNSGTKVTVKCDRGYISKQKTATCMYGQWSPRNPDCFPAPCIISRLQNGKFKSRRRYFQRGEKVEHNERLMIECDEGFESDVNEANCKYGRFDPVPSCKEAPCIISRLQNGKFKSRRRYFQRGEKVEHNERLMIECDEGFESDVNEANCKYGRFDPVPSCKEAPCIISRLQNGKFKSRRRYLQTGEKVEHNERLMIECDEGFESDVNEANCKYGRFDPVPSCKEVHCKIPKLKNGNFVDNSTRKKLPESHLVPHDTDLLVDCDEGFTTNGTIAVKCYSGSIENILCQEIKNCYHPARRNNVLYNFGSNVTEFPHNSTIHARCQSFGKFSLHGERHLTCLYGHWKPNPPMCKELGRRDEPPELIVQGKHMQMIDETVLIVQKNAKVFCNHTNVTEDGNEYFHLEWNNTRSNFRHFQEHSDEKGVKTITIEQVGSNVTIYCLLKNKTNSMNRFIIYFQDIFCQWPLPPKYGFVEVDSVLPNSTARYSCMSGYRLSGKEVVTCDENGQWSESVDCRPTICQNPVKLKNGRVSIHNLKGGRFSANVTCETHYILHPPNNQTNNCTETGGWANRFPFCVPWKAELPPSISYDVLTGEYNELSENELQLEKMGNITLYCHFHSRQRLIFLLNNQRVFGEFEDSLGKKYSLGNVSRDYVFKCLAGSMSERFTIKVI